MVNPTMTSCKIEHLFNVQTPAPTPLSTILKVSPTLSHSTIKGTNYLYAQGLSTVSDIPLNKSGKSSIPSWIILIGGLTVVAVVAVVAVLINNQSKKKKN